MTKTLRILLQNGRSYDETDRVPSNINITYFDLSLYVFGIFWYFVDLGTDINLVVRYYLEHKFLEFWWTLASMVIPSLVNTAVSIRMYIEDDQNKDKAEQFSLKEPKKCCLRITMLIFLMASVLRAGEALNYALKSRRAKRQGDPTMQRRYYKLMLDEDADAALLKIFECFLEAAPQQVLQISLLLQGHESLRVSQLLTIASSIVGMAWCLASYQRAIRFAEQDKTNMNWRGTTLQILWHFFVSLGRIISISIIAYLYPYWTLVACGIHIFVMALSLKFMDRSQFCLFNIFAEWAFSFALGTVYIFTYILPVEGRTRSRYLIYYTICGIENIICAVIWYIFVNDYVRSSGYFHLVLVLSVVPYFIGLFFMLVYYSCFHHKVSYKDVLPLRKKQDGMEDISL